MNLKKLFDPIAFSKAIEESPFTRREIAEMVACGASDIHRYEKGEFTPRPDRLKKFVEILGPSITGLSVRTNGRAALRPFTPDERQFLAWFRSLPHPRQCRLLGFCEAVVAFGNDVDADFAATLSEQLARENQPPQEQSG